MDEKELKEKVEYYCKELEKYKDFDNASLKENKTFSDLIMEIQLTIESNSELNAIFQAKQQYYKDIEDEVNNLIGEILANFKSELKEIDPKDLKNARDEVVSNSDYEIFVSGDDNKKFVFNRVLFHMGIIDFHFFNGPYISAQDFINNILNYNLEFKEDIFFHNSVHAFRAKIKQICAHNFLYDFEGKLKTSFDVEKSEIILQENLDRIEELLISIPRKNCANISITTKAVFLLFEYMGTSLLANKEPKYNSLYYSNINNSPTNYIHDVINTLKYLKSKINSFSFNQEENHFPTTIKSNYRFKKIKDGLLKNKISVTYKETQNAILNTEKRQKIFEYLLSRPKEFGIPSKDIITICEIDSKNPFNTLKTYLHETNSMLRDIHNSKDKNLFIIIDSNDKINTNIPL